MANSKHLQPNEWNSDSVFPEFNTADPFSPASGNKLFPTIDRRYLLDGYYPDYFHYAPNNESLPGDHPDAILDALLPESCWKCDHHNEFFETRLFNKSNLPPLIRNDCVLQWIQSLFPFVVRLAHLNYNEEGQVVDLKYGTGRVVVFPKRMHRRFLCTDGNCSHRAQLGDAHSVYSGLGVITANHVVATNDEAKNTVIRFFYDHPHTQDCIEEKGHRVIISNGFVDYTIFTCNTHDERLVDSFETYTMNTNVRWLLLPRYVKEKLKQYSIIISHPHGKSKRISSGKIQSQYTEDTSCSREQNILNKLFKACEEQYKKCDGKFDHLQRFTYYASEIIKNELLLPVKSICYKSATCSGSSGAPGFSGNVFWINGVEFNSPWTHKGALGNVNYCYDFCGDLGFFFQSRIYYHFDEFCS